MYCVLVPRVPRGVVTSIMKKNKPVMSVRIYIVKGPTRPTGRRKALKDGPWALLATYTLILMHFLPSVVRTMFEWRKVSWAYLAASTLILVQEYARYPSARRIGFANKNMPWRTRRSWPTKASTVVCGQEIGSQ